MNGPTRGARPRLLLVLALAALLGAGCAAGGKAARGDRQVGLLLATDAYELHLLDGKVYQLVRSADGGHVERREVTSYEQFRELYRVEAGGELPATPPPEGLEISGWEEDRSCVRDGYLCSEEPEPKPTRAPLVFRLTWP